jgi:hypothetical protein
MNHMAALNKLLDGVNGKHIKPSIAVAMLRIAQEHPCQKLIWRDPDAWGSEINLYVSYVPETEFSFAQTGFTVEFEERTLY